MTPAQEAKFRKHFPRLVTSAFSFESPRTNDYNCFAWALGQDDRRFDPVGGYWPSGLARRLNLQTFIILFEQYGHEICGTGELEEGYEKIAIFVGEYDGGRIGPTHGAPFDCTRSVTKAASVLLPDHCPFI